MKEKRNKYFAALVLGILFALCMACTVSAAPKNEIVTKNGKKYYYDKKGKLVKSKYGYKIGSKYYRINKKGVLTRVTKAEGLAGIQLNEYYGKSKSKALYQAFQWSANLSYYTNPTSGKGVAYFAIYGFTRNRGDCNVQAATFYYMAKVLGYNAEFVQGYVPTAKNSAGEYTEFGAHAWVTISSTTKTYVYDPNFSGYCKRNSMLRGIKSGYKIQYGQKNTYAYCDLKKQVIK